LSVVGLLGVIAISDATGDVSPLSSRHGPPRILDAFEEMTLIQSILNKLDLYLKEIKQELIQATGTTELEHN